MVLLTSGTVSVIISSGVVCTFTFLLFLCGYVLQQQSVRSLQEAIRQPPERKPVPTLPAKFRHPENELFEAVVGENIDGSVDSTIVNEMTGARGSKPGDNIQVPVDVDGQGLRRVKESRISEDGSSFERLAYFFALQEPSDLCSALYFADLHRNASNLSIPPSLVLLYPATWESSGSVLHTSILSFMRTIQESQDLIYHPVPIDERLGVKAQLLGELQWTRWNYDRGMYLRLPGTAIDVQLLDDALRQSEYRKAWGAVHGAGRLDPEILLYTPQGLKTPRKDVRPLAASPITPKTFEDQVYFESQVKSAGYVLLDQYSSESASEIDPWLRNVVGEYDRGRKGVCAGSNLLHGID
ncbi:hypothetical protein B0A52_08568 [Exophiala mesophila]|uniref:Uncharacterized protein n=1 Tax=Exophiala mesophila TaxID=212818 RepID=A0A438MTW9_EXOME|nr:hypothetical protein B0A52_08568 [Exophiala mesophila]